MDIKTDHLTNCCPGLKEHLQPELFRALGDPTRLVLLTRLAIASEPATVNRLADCCGVHLSGVSRHLALLRDAGVVDSEKQGREVLYSLNRKQLTGTLRGLADAIDTCKKGDSKNEPQQNFH